MKYSNAKKDKFFRLAFIRIRGSFFMYIKSYDMQSARIFGQSRADKSGHIFIDAKEIIKNDIPKFLAENGQLID